VLKDNITILGSEGAIIDARGFANGILSRSPSVDVFCRLLAFMRFAAISTSLVSVRGLEESTIAKTPVLFPVTMLPRTMTGQVRSLLDKRVGAAVTVALVSGAVRAVKSLSISSRIALD